ncbi:MAG: FHA domain-containing protein [Chloroflexota bacterium]|nr:MAG: FHA domain-containing protein [Chloroflexota bacterium]
MSSSPRTMLVSMGTLVSEVGEVLSRKVRNKRIWRLLAIILTIILLAGISSRPSTGQQDSPQLQITGIDTTGFPTITFRLEVIDSQGNRVGDLTDLAIFEDGEPISQFESRPLDTGVDLFIIIDANSTIEDRDETEGQSRREKVRDSIIRYANRFMDPTQLDRVTVIVPEGGGGRFLDRPSMTFPNEVINAVNFYLPDELNDISLDRLLLMALDEASRNAQEGRYQAIVLYSDAADLSDRMDAAGFLARAQEQNVAVYPVILGSRADTHEIEQAVMLSEPTGGNYFHMPDPADTDELYDRLQQRGVLTEVSFRSALDSSGQHVITAEWAGGQGEASLELVVKSPSVQMAVDNRRPIVRVASESDTPFELMEPTNQPLVAQVDWPDGHPRDLVSATLLVDGTEQPLSGSVLGADGILTFDWDISALAADTYDLQIQVVDELGLVGATSPLPLTIEIQRPVIPPTEAPTAVPTPSPAPTSAPATDEFQLPDNPVLVTAGAVLVIAILAIAAVAVLLARRRRPDPDATAAVVRPSAMAAQPAGQSEPEFTHVVAPEFAADSDAGAFLEVLENAPEHPGFIPIGGNNITLGRDPRRVAVPFKDRSVSRLHARILESYGAYRIYDEGSASGTYVNYERVSLAPRTLEDKDQIHLGRVHLRFHLASSMPPIATEPDADSAEVTDTQIYGQE